MSESVEDVTLKISGQEFRHWNELELTLQLDSFATAAFRAPMEPDRPEFRQLFRPFSYASVEVATNGEELFTGTMLSVDPQVDETGRTVTVQSYAKPGVLQDCTLPASAFPIEFSKLSLFQIARACCGYLGVEVEPMPLLAEDPPFERVELKPDQVVFEFLSDLAKQRNLVLSSTPAGRLQFLRPLPAGPPVAVLVEGQAPLRAVKPSFDPQGYHTEVTGLGTSKLGGKGSSHTEKNSQSPSGVVRPLNFQVDSTEAASMPQATKARMGRMFGAMVSYEFELPTWRTPTGQLWQPGQFLMLTAPGAMIYQPTLLMVRSIVLRQSSGARSATFNAVLPGSYSGEVPAVLPWA